MKIAISNYRDDDETVRYTVLVENGYFKGTNEFYDYAEAFNEFAERLSKFPFEQKDTIKFQADNILIEVSLLDPVGGIDFKIFIEDDEGSSVGIHDTTVEVEALNRLAELLSSTDFSNETSIIWES